MVDFWPGNIIVKLGTSEEPPRLHLDWELAKTGNPAVDISKFCGEMYLFTQFDKVARAPSATILTSFLGA
jgi:RNA polymerase II subunit A-like phosphatase